MRRDPRMVITGCAGSGKTMLAVNHADRLAREGHRVLFTCFNTKLREDLRARLVRGRGCSGNVDCEGRAARPGALERLTHRLDL